MRISFEEIQHRVLKPDEAQKPWYARKVTHVLSIGLIWIFQKSNLSPNTITLGSLVSGLLGTYFFTFMEPVPILWAAFWIQIYYVLDALDGQWARFKNAASLTGAFFDSLVVYIVQPLVLFAIGWGIFRETQQPIYIFLGFTSAFSSLWVLLIWNIRWSILLDDFSRKGIAPPRWESIDSALPNSKPEPLSGRWCFSWIHKSMVFPWFMHILTVASLGVFLVQCLFGKNIIPVVFPILVLYYGVMGPAIGGLLTGYWIMTRRIDLAE